MEFHRKLCSFCDNSYLQKALEEALRICTRISNQYYTQSWKCGNEQNATCHEQIVRALRVKDLDAFREELF